MTASVPVTAVATKYPEAQLAGVLTDFSPTYNGSQAPATVGTSNSDWGGATAPTSVNAVARTDIVVEFRTADAAIITKGESTHVGAGSDNGSAAQAATDVFNLNVRPDSVSIRITESTLDSEGVVRDVLSFAYANLEAPPTSTFVDGQFFTPVAINLKYGYQAEASSTVLKLTAGADSTTASADVTVAFTFRKTGFNDLTVEYKVHADSAAAAV